MNSVLQALTHTPPLATLLTEEKLSAPSSSNSGIDYVKALKDHVGEALGARVVTPSFLANHLPSINKR